MLIITGLPAEVVKEIVRGFSQSLPGLIAAHEAQKRAGEGMPTIGEEGHLVCESGCQ